LLSLKHSEVLVPAPKQRHQVKLSYYHRRHLHHLHCSRQRHWVKLDYYDRQHLHCLLVLMKRKIEFAMSHLFLGTKSKSIRQRPIPLAMLTILACWLLFQLP